MGRSWIVLPLLLALCLIGGGGAAGAQGTPPGFAPFKHVRWGADEGAPDGVTDMAQTGDGYLWLASDGLYRFDGVSFERIDWPAGSGKRHASPTALMAGRDGALWVGLRDRGGVALYRGGELHDLHMPDPPRTVATLAQTPDGAIWAGSGVFDRRLLRLRAGRWEAVDETLGLPPGSIMGLDVDRHGGLWVALTHQDGQSGALAYLPPGAARFRAMPYALTGRPHIALDRNGALWVSDGKGTRMLADGDGAPPRSAIGFAPVPDLRTATILFDSTGSIWGTTASVGLFRIQGSGSPGVDRFRATNGLTSDFAYSPFLDREGNIWIATESGIDQFRRASAVQDATIPADPTSGLLISGASDGSVHVVSRRTLFRIAPGGAPKPIRTLDSGDMAMCPARGGGVWVVQAAETLWVRDDRSEASPPYPGGEVPNGCAEDRAGRLWVPLLSGRMTWRDAGGWHVAAGPLADQRVWDIATTPAGDLAFITRADMAMLRGNRLSLTKLAATGIGTLTTVSTGLRDTFVGGSGGLVRVRDGRIAMLDERRFPFVAWLRGLVQTPQGETWMVTHSYIARVATADLDRAFDDPHAPLPHILFNAQDGLVSAAQHAGFIGRQIVAGGDGRVWFLNRQGAARFDPATLARNTLPPPVAIRSLASGGQVWRDPAQLILPPGTRAIDIAFVGLSLTVPQRMHFRYRLEGADDDWVDAGSRRIASYANLGPGSYRFQVIAANNDGVWNRTGATLRFEIRPTFVQGWPFKLLCAAALLALLWLAYAMRVRSVAQRLRQRMAERMDERERIARELHDTLLQSVQSLTLHFQMAVDDLPTRAHARAGLEAAIDRADRAIAEGRDRVRDLRAQQDGDIEQILCDIVARQGFDPAVEIAITRTGTPRPLQPLVLDEIIRIAGEAVFNIRRHACATRIGIEIAQAGDFRLRFADNGVGIDPAIAQGGARPGHFGLPGMRERARKLRGTLVVRPLPAGGTELVLTVPGAVAYKPGRSRFARFWSFE